MIRRALKVLFVLCGLLPQIHAAEPALTKRVAGVVITAKQEVVQGALITVRCGPAQKTVATDASGRFSLEMPAEAISIDVSGAYLAQRELQLAADQDTADLRIEVAYLIPSLRQELVITASALDPGIERRNGAVYSDTLFSRDDQIFDTLAAGINAGQHEGGGKSLEIRRFGFNLDHGGVSGGLKVLVDDVQQNQGTQGHGQGYLGQLKGLSPELVQDVDILNGPFSAEYGDFSGLGVVHVRLRETLPEVFTVRLQGGSFDSLRGFVGSSPVFKHANAFIAYEGSKTDGPFQNPLRYRRDNLTGNYTWRLRSNQTVGARLNLARNDFFSSGQLPLDEVAGGRLDRFGFIDPFDGGHARNGTFATYYRRDFASGDIFRADGFLSRSLFDLYSNFTFFLNDPVNGDEIQQRDSRLQEGLNAQYLHPYKLLGQTSLLTAGSNFHDNQINVGLLHTAQRTPLGTTTSAHAHVTNAAFYLQQGIDFAQRRMHVDAGVRYDQFRFRVEDRLVPAQSGIEFGGRLQPKANFSYAPFSRVPLTLHASYGRGISSQDARGVVQQPQGPKLATTDFYQLGTSHNLKKLSVSTDIFLIDRSNEQVYIPDDGSFELRGPSRAYGFEVKNSWQITRFLALNSGITRVGNAFYRGTMPRLYVDSAPHTVANAGLTLSRWRKFSSSLRYRHIDGYRLDGLNDNIRARGLDVLDLSVTRQLRRGVDFNLAVDNLASKRYFETQNFFESRVRPDEASLARVHATPGFPIGVTIGLSFRLGER